MHGTRDAPAPDLHFPGSFLLSVLATAGQDWAEITREAKSRERSPRFFSFSFEGEYELDSSLFFSPLRAETIPSVMWLLGEGK